MALNFDRAPRPFFVSLSVVAALTVLSIAGVAWDRGTLSDYHERRARLVSETGDGVVVLFGYSESDVAASTTPFHQNEAFYYLTGWDEPDAIMMVVPKTAKGPGGATAEIDKEIFYIPAHDYRLEKWTGPKLGPDDPDSAARTGFPTVKPAALFHADLLEALKTFPKIYTELTPQPESGEDGFQKEILGKVRKLAPLAELADMRPLLARMRMVKSPGEIALTHKAVEASVDAHLAAMKAVRPGVWEYEISALMKYEFERRGCEWPAYPPIVGSGFYSTVLHYDRDSQQMQGGEVVVLDVAGAYSGYTADITRTLPVNGRFTPRQREIYEIVLGAQNAAIAAARPGVISGRRGAKGLQEIAYDYINSHGKDLHGKSLGDYFIHGLSHSVGLNVHDPADYNLPLEPGMIVTVEPGIYIPEEKIGVRIEDMILITSTGAELLTRRLPRNPDEVEKTMTQK